MQQIAVIGLGKVGALVGTLLHTHYHVTGLDRVAVQPALPFDCFTGHITDTDTLHAFLKGKDVVVSCLPCDLNLEVARAAHQLGLHYFDLTEDVPTTEAIRAMAPTAKGVMAPQCGLAPGFIGILGADLCKKFDRLRDVELRVGALPRNPNGLLGYAFNWSPAGVINEYINDAEVIHNGVRKMVPSLDGLEMIHIGGQQFEAFSTSGGLGTFCETLEGKVDTLNYKTMRYPGHARLMRFLLYELLLKEDKTLAEKILTGAKPAVEEDVVHVYAAVEGWKNGTLAREEFYQAYEPLEIAGKKWRAISWTTAASIASVVDLVASGELPQQGFIRQEDIPLPAFAATRYGRYYFPLTAKKL